MKYQQYLPKLIITREMIQAFQDNDYHTLHLLIDWATLGILAVGLSSATVFELIKGSGWRPAPAWPRKV
jgi:hypothetical protein